MLPGKGTHAFVLFFTMSWALSASAQAPVASTHSETRTENRISAEMVKGKLNPATSKPGDEVTLRLNQDVKSDGQVLLKKGSTIRGVVRKVQRSESKASAKGNSSAQSMLELQWFAPEASGAAAQQLNVALQSVVYTNPLYAHQQSEQDAFIPAAPAASSAGASRSTGGLVGGVGGTVGGAVTSVSSVGAGVGGAQGAASTGVLAQTQSAIGTTAAIPANAQTAAALQSTFGVSSNQLVQVGSGQVISSGGTTTSMDIFTHMSNDTVITSPSRDFEISSGAQMQLLLQTR